MHSQRSPQAPSLTIEEGQDKSQVTPVNTDAGNCHPDIPLLLNMEPGGTLPDSFAKQQRKDSDLQEIINFLEKEQLPYDTKRACKIALQASLFTIDNPDPVLH